MSIQANAQTYEVMLLHGRLLSVELKTGSQEDIEYYFTYNFSLENSNIDGRIPSDGSNLTGIPNEVMQIPNTLSMRFLEGSITNGFGKNFTGEFALHLYINGSEQKISSMPVYAPRIPSDVINATIYEESCQSLSSSILCTHHYNYSKVYFSVFYEGKLATGSIRSPTSQTEASLSMFGIILGILVLRRKSLMMP
ncbi:MAG: hypothetical protein D6732_11190 [Methanobacteriota archaeon]|nr:MAG: hypothetical protein D6732_11190 [Euryarchaeota archaeon]